MAKICFPNYQQGEFDSLADALEFLKNETSIIPRSALCEIVQCNIHIGHLFESFDFGDNKYYQNYISSNSPITESDMKNAYGVSHRVNFRMVHESIPEDKLPILYYNGNGQYMLLASKPVH